MMHLLSSFHVFMRYLFSYFHDLMCLRLSDFTFKYYHVPLLYFHISHASIPYDLYFNVFMICLFLSI